MNVLYKLKSKEGYLQTKCYDTPRFTKNGRTWGNTVGLLMTFDRMCSKYKKDVTHTDYYINPKYPNSEWCKDVNEIPEDWKIVSCEFDKNVFTEISAREFYTNYLLKKKYEKYDNNKSENRK